MSNHFLPIPVFNEADRGVSLSVLGWVPGIITMVLCGIIFWITSITMHKYIMKHPHIMDICEFVTVRVSRFLLATNTNSLITNRRLWIPCIWTEQSCLRLLFVHAACKQYSSDRISHFDWRQGPEYPFRPLIVHCSLLNNCGNHGNHHIHTPDLAAC